MLTIQQIKEDPRRIVERLAVKGYDGTVTIQQVIDLDSRRRQAQLTNDNKAAELNRLAASIGKLMKEGNKEEAEKAKAAVAALKEEQKAIADELSGIEAEIRNILLSIPNVPCDMVPEGKTAEDNVVESTGGPMPDLPADALPHWDLAKKYNLIDFDLGVKITGAGFPVYIGKGARLQRALRYSPLTLSTKLRATAQASSPTKRVRCTISTKTIYISYPPPRYRSPTYTATSYSTHRSSP